VVTQGEIEIQIKARDQATAVVKSFENTLATFNKTMSGTGDASKTFNQSLDNIPPKTQAAAKSTDGLGAAFHRARESAAGMGKQIIGVAGGLAAFTAGQALAQTALKGTIGAAMDYERTLNVMQATSSATAAEMSQISARAKQLGADNTLAAVSANDAANAMIELARAGLTVTDTMDAARGVLQLAAAGELATAEAATITANALNAFGLSGSEASRVADMLAAAANASSADVRDLGMGMSQASAVFRNANQPIETLITSMVMMSNAGVQGSDAATSLKTAMLALQAPTAKAQSILDEYGISLRDASGQMLPFREIIEELSGKLGVLSDAQRDAALKTIFGSDAIRAAQIVFMAGADAYDANAEAVGRAGAANELAAAQMKGAAGAIAGFQSELETIGLTLGEKALPHIVTFMQGISGLLGVITSAPGPIKVATAALLGLGAAALVFAANPVVAGILAIGTALTFMTGKLQQAKAAQEAVNAAVMGASASAMDTYAKALKNIDAAGGGLTERQAFLRDQVSSLAIAYGRGNDALQAAADKYNELEKAHGKTSVQAEAQKKIVIDLTQSQYNLAGSLQVARKAIDDGGASLMEQAEAAASAKRAVEETARGIDQAGEAAKEAGPNFELLGQAMGITAEKAEEADLTIDSLLKRIDEITGSATAAEMTWGRQTTALDSVASSAKAMTSALNPEDLAAWAARAREMATQSEATAPAIAGMHREIDIIAKGGPGAADALDRLNKLVDAAKTPYTDAAAATRDYADAQGAAAKETLGIGGALESLGKILQQTINDFLVGMGRIPPGAREAMRLLEDAVEIDLSKPGANLAISLANGFDKEKIRVVDGAGNVIHEVKGSLSDADMSPEGVGLMQQIAAGIESAGGDVSAAAVGVVASAAVAAGQGAEEISANIKAVLGLTNLTPEAAAIIDTMAKGLLAGSADVTANMAKVIEHLRTAANVNLSAEGRNAAASFAAGLMAGIDEARVAAAIVASTPADQFQQTLQTGSPSRVMIHYGEMTTAGYVIGLLAGTGEVVGAIRHISHEALTELEAGVSRFNAFLDSGAIDMGLYTAGLADLSSEYDRLTTVIPQATAAFDQWNQRIDFRGLRQASIDTANLDAEIARLNRELLYVEPYSEREAAIKRDIDILEAWRAKVTANLDVLDAEAKALEASKTAWDGVTEAREAFLKSQDALSRFGGGADLSNLLTAAMGPDAGAAEGRDAFAGLEKFITSLIETLGPQMQAVGEQLRFLFWASFNLDTPEAREAAKGQFDNVLAGLEVDAQARGTLTADTYANAYAAATEAANLAERVGPTFKSFFDLLEQQAQEGSEANIAKIGEMAVGIEREIGKLPAAVQGEVGAQWAAAWQQFLDEPGSPDNIARIQEAARRINQASQVIPENLEKLTPQMQRAAIALWQAVDRGDITLKQAIERWNALGQQIPKNLEKLEPDVRAAVETLNQLLIDGMITAEEYAKRLEGAMEAAAMAAQRAKDVAANAAAAAAAANPNSPNFGGMAAQSWGSQGLAGPATSQANLWALAHIQGPLASPEIAAAFAAGEAQIYGAMSAAAVAAQATQAQSNADAARISQLVQTAVSAGLGAEAYAILSQYTNSQISAADAVRLLEALIASGGSLGQARRRGNPFRSGANGGGSGGSDNAILRKLDDLIHAVERVGDRPVTATIVRDEVGQAAAGHFTDLGRNDIRRST